LHCFLVLPIALRLQNLWWVSLQGPSCWVILDVVYIVYIYIYIYAHANYSGGLVQLEMGCDDWKAARATCP
jgi:hypothetical protein